MTTAINGDFDIVGGGYVRLNGNKKIKLTLPSKGKLYGVPWGKVYKAELWKGIQFPDNYWFEDTICEFLIHDRAKSRTSVPKLVYEWRINKNSISFSSKKCPKILDTIYITHHLIEDRNKLELPINVKFYDTLLHQFKINTVRVYNLNDRMINYSNFIISKTLFEKLYGDNKFKSKNYKEIEEALQKK